MAYKRPQSSRTYRRGNDLEITDLGYQVALAVMALVVVLIAWAVTSDKAEGAEPTAGIAAVVNDDVVSYTDLQDRLKLALEASNLPNRPEIVERLKQQIQDQLINESLEIQEARRLGIEITEADIDAGFATIAKQNGMPPDVFRKALIDKGVKPATLRNQVKAEILWSKVIQAKLRPQVSISEDDIDAEIEQRRAMAGKPEYLLAEIFLPVDDPSNDAKTKAFAGKLVDEIARGAPFPAVARQFSQSAGAASGGDMGWVAAGQMPEELDDAVQKMKKGQISPPIRTIRGYHILFLRDQRKIPETAAGTPEAALDLKQIFLPFSGEVNDELVATLTKRAEKIRDGVSGCDAMEEEATKYPSKLSGDLGTVRLADLPGEIRAALENLPEGTPSVPIQNAEGIAVVMVCGRKTISNEDQQRDAIAHDLGLQRLDLLQQRYLRDLRTAAFIEKRV